MDYPLEEFPSTNLLSRQSEGNVAPKAADAMLIHDEVEAGSKWLADSHPAFLGDFRPLPAFDMPSLRATGTGTHDSLLL